MLIQWRRNALNVRNFENKFEEKLLYYFNFEKQNSEENVHTGSTTQTVHE